MSASTFKAHPVFARMWIKLAPKGEEKGVAEHRDDLLAGLSGRVLELGAGNGLNFSHYPEAVSQVVAVEPEPTLRKAAREAAESAPVPVEVVDGVADALPGKDGEFDAAVASLVLCSVPDQASALAELRRIIRPGGQLRFYEHVQADTQPAATLLKVADKTFWPLIAGGCHPTRQTQEAIEAAGFDIVQCRRFRFSAGAPEPKLPYILGRANRP
jgi:ubiquinone/menaquinone biosynthesis C-methylase UbiE